MKNRITIKENNSWDELNHPIDIHSAKKWIDESIEKGATYINICTDWEGSITDIESYFEREMTPEEEKTERESIERGLGRRTVVLKYNPLK